MPGPAPKRTRRRANPPARGDWQATAGAGWQHGPIPDPPDGLCDSSKVAWDTWMKSWWAVHWLPEDIPGLHHTIQFFDQCQRAFEDPFIEEVNTKGETVFVRRPNPGAEARQMLDNYGITPKGQQDRRWARPEAAEKPAPAVKTTAKGAIVGIYDHLKVLPAAVSE